MTEVRRIRPDEGPALQTVRLAALADAPSAFGSSYAAEVDQPDEHWTGRATVGASGDDGATFFATDGGTVVGLVAAYRPEAIAPAVELVSMWVAPGHRRAGLARRLVDAVVGWADGIGAPAVELWVTDGNDPAVALYQAAGFRPTAGRQPLPSDPSRDEVRLRLDR